ncbi:2-oxo acid dehydrogenase subunit E2 [Sinanaerobacter chloroacetimidivorans]|uniref:Dihydrolipoamide acetyltransferase component of pyruvate dehydrogenase complex n=1 Tax=Sinanaerobacter chloroacetimidivorans TaxID=2818044 RepID=A0A8J7W2Y8_9FIRM|nr:2-oxo acid dehydrogenase subunit E2 [Sinanaerobacter chloroacetimidivorans]MBR0599924.1 2-oxo acid dehydrogenase subunit E2 [Sinanaerobacter chloroacetimidivorans]
MASVLVMPKLGLTMTEGIIAKWHKQEGDSVRAGEILYEVETDKLTNDVESKEDGILLKIIIPEGETAPCLEPVAIIGTAGEDISGLAGAGGTTAETPKEGGKAERIIASPAAKKLAAEKKITLEKIQGTGPKGRIILKDVEEYQEDLPVSGGDTSGVVKVKATPVAAKMAAELDVNLTELSAEGRRISKADVAAFVKQGPQPKQRATEAVVPMSAMRKVIAKRMGASHSTCPTVTYDISIDMSALQSMKDGMKKETIKISYTDILTYIAARTLLEFPLLNCTIDGENLIYKNYVNMGIAVALPDGLLVPVIRNAHQKGITEISTELLSLSEDAKNGNLAPDALQGGTFTITNLGMYGIESFSPIINLPEVAILGVNTIQKAPVYEGGTFVMKPLMKVSLTADHRAVDGAVAAQFLSQLKRNMENPYLLML